MNHVREALFHPQTQGKIERWRQTLKNRILLENYFCPGDLEGQIEAFVEHYNHQRYYESLGNVTPADAYFARAETIETARKDQTTKHRTAALAAPHDRRLKSNPGETDIELVPRSCAHRFDDGHRTCSVYGGERCKIGGAEAASGAP